MTGKERLAIAMQLGTPDRVPFMCQLSIGHLLRNSSVRPREIWHSAEGFSRAIAETADAYDMDGVLVNVWPCERDWEQQFAEVEEQPGRDIVTFRNGSVIEYDTDGNVLSLSLPEDGRAVPPTIHDIDPVALRDEQFPETFFDSVRLAIERCGAARSVHFEIGTPFMVQHQFIGISEALVSLISEPELTHELQAAAIFPLVRRAQGGIDAGCDAIVISSPYAGSSFVSRRVYEEFVLPYERELIRQIHAYRPDMPVYTHTCGFLGDRIELLLDSGVNGIECLDPPPLGDVSIEDAYRRVGGRAFIKGNLDSVNELLPGDVELARRAATHRIEVAGRHGAYILSTSCSVAPGVPPHIMRVLHDVAAGWQY